MQLLLIQKMADFLDSEKKKKLVLLFKKDENQ
jgi:hypothetical protein